MTGRAADAEQGTLGGGDAVSRAVRASDGVQLHYLCWSTGRSPPWAVVVFLHGIASHGGWFAETAADLDDQGVAVYAPDRRGSGRSGGPRGHLLQGEDDATMDVAGTRHWFPGSASRTRPTGPIPAPATPWTSSRIAAGTWPIRPDGCRLGSHRSGPGRLAVVPRCRR